MYTTLFYKLYLLYELSKFKPTGKLQLSPQIRRYIWLSTDFNLCVHAILVNSSRSCVYLCVRW